MVNHPNRSRVGRPLDPDRKLPVTTRLSPDVHRAYRASGRTIDDLLRGALGL